MIIIKEDILTNMLEQYPDWPETPSKFLSFILLVDELSQVDAELSGVSLAARMAFAEQLAGLFISLLEVDIAPYKDYRDLTENCPLPDDHEEILRRIAEKIKEDDRIMDLAEETGIMPSKETILTDLAHEFLAWRVIEQLRPHVDFR